MLADGSVFRGRADVPGTACGEVVFNTSMTGYQEILTDPSYRRQIVVMTQPHIGNYGTSTPAEESSRPWVEGFVARRFTRRASGCGSQENLLDYLARQRVPALSGIDTRALVRHLRDKGAMAGVLSSDVENLEHLQTLLHAVPSMAGRALVDEVTRSHRETIEPANGTPHCHIAVYDFGAKGSIVGELVTRGARVTVLPSDTPAAACRALDIDGVVLSNGPGDPEPLTEVVETVRALVDTDLPIFGICLGHQLLALALGGRTFKLKFGHHGGNQPVKEVATGRVTITSQNHGFAVDPDSLPTNCRVTHVNLNDGTIEGIALDARPVFSVQYHPEAAPGPHDARDLFDRFLDTLPATASARPTA